MENPILNQFLYQANLNKYLIKIVHSLLINDKCVWIWNLNYFLEDMTYMEPSVCAPELHLAGLFIDKGVFAHFKQKYSDIIRFSDFVWKPPVPTARQVDTFERPKEDPLRWSNEKLIFKNKTRDMIGNYQKNWNVKNSSINSIIRFINSTIIPQENVANFI